MISQQALARRLGISRSAVASHILNLTASGAIRGRGYLLGTQPTVVAVGGANMDICGRPAGPIHARDSNPGSVSTSPGGVARNVAENLARLGLDCRLISAVGNDDDGRRLLRQGREAGIDMQLVQVLDAARTSTYLSVLDATGDLATAISDMAILDAVDATSLARHERLIRQASVIFVDTNLTEAALGYLAGISGDRGLFVDTVSAAKAPRIAAHLARVDTLKASLGEAEALLDRRLRSSRQLAPAARHFHEQGVRQVFVTLGERGVFFSDGNEAGIVGPGDATAGPVNTAGAGDAFAAALIYCRIARKSLPDTLAFAAAAARLTLSHSASNHPALSVQAIEQML